MYKVLVNSFSFLLLLSVLTPITASAKQGVFSNQVQMQSLNDLSDIVEDSKGINLRRSSRSLHLTLNRLHTASRSIRALGNFRTRQSKQYAYRPYAFIQTTMDRRKLLESMNNLITLHTQYNHAIKTKNKAQQRTVRKLLFKQFVKINHIRNKWRSKLGKVGLHTPRIQNLRNLRICRNLLPHEKYYSQWESCCDIGKNKSRWLKRANNKVNNWTGSCRSWGIQ